MDNDQLLHQALADLHAVLANYGDMLYKDEADSIRRTIAILESRLSR